MRIVFVILVIFIMVGCGYIPPKWLITPTGGKQAVASAYHLSRKPFEYSDLIDTNAIYIGSEDLVTTNWKGEKIAEATTHYRFMRFNNKGILFMRSFMYDYPTDEIANNMERGQYCFYTVRDSIIKIEKRNHDLRRFDYWYGRIKESGDIHFYKYKGRPWGKSSGKLNYLYRKTPATLTKPIIFPEKSWEGEAWY